MEAAAGHEEYIHVRLNREHAVVAVTLVPDLDGYVEIDARSFRVFRDSVTGTSPFIAGQDSVWQRTLIRAGRLIADRGGAIGDLPRQGSDRLRGLASVLHQSGAGTIAIPLLDHIVDSTAAVDTYSVVNAVMSGLVFLGRHARDRAAAGGNASLRATIWPADRNKPLALVHVDRNGFRNLLGSALASYPPVVATGVAEVEDLAAGGASMLSATHALCTGLVQEFGYPEVDHITRGGQIQLDYWPAEVEVSLQTWAARVGVSVISATTTTSAAT
jgi:hypothetical protein